MIIHNFCRTLPIITFLSFSIVQCFASLPEPKFSTPSQSSSPQPSLLVTETFQRGIFFQHLQQSQGLHGLDDTLGSGACVFDMDNDGDLDLYFVAGSGATRFFGKQHWWSKQPKGQLYKNNGKGFFELIDSDTGLPDSHWGMGCNSADIDNDGYEDLIISGRGKNWISFGDGEGLFNTKQLGSLENWSTSVSLKDINNDGLLDIYVGNYISYQKNNKTLEVNTGFNDESAPFKAENYPAQKNELYINKGDRTYLNVADQYNIANPDGRTLAVNWINKNNDAWPDLLIFNDTGSESQVYINHQGNHFSRAPLSHQIDSLKGIHSSALINLNNSSNNATTVFSSKIGNPLYLLIKDRENYKNITWNTLIDNDKQEISSHWGIASADFNGDGLDDLYLGAGLSTPDSDSPKVPQGQPDTLLLQTSRHKLYKDNRRRDPNLSTRSVIPADIDNDGDTDLVITHNNGPAQIKINYSNPEFWTGLDIQNSYGIKNSYNKIIIKQNERTINVYPNNDNFLANQDYRKTIKLNSNSEFSVTVNWQEGNSSYYQDLKTNKFYLLNENKIAIETNLKSSILENPMEFELAIWQLKSKKIDWRRMLNTFSLSDRDKKYELLQEAYASGNKKLSLALIENTLRNDDYLSNIPFILKSLEAEISIPLITEVIDKHLNCDVTNMLHFWFNEEESMLLRKNTLASPLIKKLRYSKPDLQICILRALSKSKLISPVKEIENLLINSKNHGVKNAALYSLGELRRSESIMVLESYINDPRLKNEASIALKKINQETNGKPLFNKGFPSLSKTTKKYSRKVNNICPRLGIAKAINLADRTLATIISLCSEQAFKNWLASDPDVVNRNIDTLINNQYLSTLQLKVILNEINGSNIKGYEILLSGLFNKVHNKNKAKVILEAMMKHGDKEIIQSIAMSVIKSEEMTKELRIAAGNILISHYPELVMNHSGSIFNED